MRLAKRLVATVVVLSLVLASTGLVSAAGVPAESIQRAAERMAKLGLVKGDSSGDLQLGAEITRAQLVTIIVRAFGRSQEAALLKGAAAFPDTQSHWASGEIAVAKRLIEANGQAIGMPDGTFNPDGKLTADQTVAMVMKFLGVRPDTTEAWPRNYRDAALTSGLINGDIWQYMHDTANSNATRGLVFYLLDRAFYAHELPGGKSVYRTYVDTIPPGLTVASYPTSTDLAQITLSGTADGAYIVWVGNQTATPDSAGAWQVTRPLKMGENEFNVRAIDLAGNETTLAKPIIITRKAPVPIAGPVTISASARDAYVPVGGTTPVTVEVKDKDGKVVKDAPYTVTVTDGIGIYDAARGLFVAGQTPGQGSLVVTLGDAQPAVIPLEVIPAEKPRRRMRIRKPANA